MFPRPRRNKNGEKKKTLEFECLEDRRVLSVAGTSSEAFGELSNTTGYCLDTAAVDPSSNPGNSSESPHTFAETRNAAATDNVFSGYLGQVGQVSEEPSANSNHASQRSAGDSESAVPITPVASGAAIASATDSPDGEKQPSDVEIGSRIAAQDENGLRMLLESHGGRVAAYLRKRFQHLDVDAALNDGAYRVWKYFDPSKKMSVGAYFSMASVSAAIDTFKGQNRLKQMVSLSETAEPEIRNGILAPAEHRELQRAIPVALAKLTDLERATIRADLDAGGKASNKDLASAFGVTSGAVTHARSSAHAKLSSLLADFDPHSDA